MGEVVCTAGVDEKGQPVRLFPIPFRTLSAKKQFQKWQWIKAAVIKAPNDSRRESFKVDLTTLSVDGEQMPSASGWADRWKHVANLLGPSMCDLREQQTTSLGLIKPRDVSLEIVDDPGEWPLKQLEFLERIEQQTTMLGEQTSPKERLEKPQVKFYYKFKCSNPKCNGHRMLFEDWEVVQAWRDWSLQYTTRAELEAKIRQRFVDIPVLADNLYLFVGTLAKRPRTWVVIGYVVPMHLRKPANPNARRRNRTHPQAIPLFEIDGTS